MAYPCIIIDTATGKEYSYAQYKELLASKLGKENSIEQLITDMGGKPTKETGGEKPPINPEDLITENLEGNKKVSTVGMRVIVSHIIDPAIKKGFEERGIEYIEKTMELTQKQAKEIIDAYEKEGRLQELVNHVIANQFEEPRIKVSLLKQLSEKFTDLSHETTGEQSEIALKKSLDLLYAAKEYGIKLGQGVNEFKDFKDMTGQDTRLVVMDAFRNLDKRNEAYFTKHKKTFEKLGKTLQELLETEEGQKLFGEKVAEQTEAELKKYAENRVGKDRLKKMDDALAKFQTKLHSRTYESMLGVPVAIIDGAVSAIRKAIYAGAKVADAVQAGIDYVKSKHKGKFDEEKFRKDSLEDLKELGISDKEHKTNKTKDAAEKLKAKLSDLDAMVKEPEKYLAGLEKKKKLSEERKTKAEAKSQDIKDLESEIKLRKKLIDALHNSDLTETQKKQILGEALDSIIKNGYLSETSFKNIFAKAIGLEHLTEADEKILNEGAKVISEVDKAEKAYLANTSDANLAAYRTAIRNGKIANEKISRYFREEKSYTDMYTTAIRMSLLGLRTVLLSGKSNLYNMFTRTPISATSTVVDKLRYGVGQAALNVVPEKYVPQYLKDKRVNDFLALQIGWYKNFGSAGIDAFKELRTGALPDEVFEREMRTSLHPIEALGRIFNKANWSFSRKALNKQGLNITEAFTGILSEPVGRLLNLTDKPFRGGTKGGVLEETATLQIKERKKELEGKETLTEEEQVELAEIKSGVALKKAVNVPSEENVEIANDEAARSVFQQKNALLKGIEAMVKTTGVDLHSKAPDHWVTAFVKNVGRIVGTTTVPFINMPLNWATEIFLMTNPLTTALIGASRASMGHTREANRLFAKALIGYGVTQVATFLIANGFVNGNGDDDTPEKKRWTMEYWKGQNRINISALERWKNTGKITGIQPGDYTREYYQLGMTGATINTVANMHEKYGEQQVLQMSGFENMLKMLPASTRTALNMPMVQNTNMIMDVLSKGQEDVWSRFIVQSAMTVTAPVHPSLLVRTINGLNKDDVLKNTKDENTWKWFKNSFKEQLGQGKDLPRKYSVWGKPILKTPTDRNAFVYQLLDFEKGQNVPNDIFGLKLWELSKRLKETEPELVKDVIPNYIPYDISIGGKPIKLNAEEKGYLDMRTGENRRKLAAMYLDGTLKSKTGKRTYDYEKDSDKKRVETLIKLYTEGYKDAKVDFATHFGYSLDKEELSKEEEDIKNDLKFLTKDAKNALEQK